MTDRDTSAVDEIELLRQSDRPQPIKPADATPDTNATPTEGSVRNRCTLTFEEREAVEAAIDRFKDWVNGFDDPDRADALRNLLERLA